MEIENAQARNLSQKKREAEVEEQRHQTELNRLKSDRQKAIESEREKGDKQLVEISQSANNQMDTAKKVNSGRVQDLNENNQKHYEELAHTTASELKRIDDQAFKTIQDVKTGQMEKIRNVTDLSADPFYRLKGLNPALSENEKEYTIKVNLPEHEAKNLFVSGEGPHVKISLARRYEDSAKNEEGNLNTRTNSYQSVVESMAMPGPYDAKKIERSFKDGVVTIKVPKLVFGEPAVKVEKS